MADERRKPVALVTGGRQGLGRGCALALAERGFDIIVVDQLDDEIAQETVAAIQNKGASVCFLIGDISSVEKHDAIVDAAWNAFGGIDCLVNNAGIAPHKLNDILDLDADSFDRNLGVNLRGSFFLTQAFARRMRDAAQNSFYRSIIFISSIAASHVSTDLAEYCISKAGLSMVSRLFAVRLADCGVHVHEVRPGFIRTAMTASAAAPRGRIEAHIESGDVPLHRWGEPKDVGQSVATLAAGEMPYLVGQAIYVDGGYHIATA